jgi:lipopolysaccharide/colanic/teichoic acid biosynthesis glycosyltransferase
VAMYARATRELVLSVRPGITDLASIEYRDENAVLGRSADPEQAYIHEVMPAKLAYCESYVRGNTLWGDLAIIGRSIVASFARR